MFQREIYCSIYTCLTQLRDSRDMYIMYYVKDNYMFRLFSLALRYQREVAENPTTHKSHFMFK